MKKTYLFIISAIVMMAASTLLFSCGSDDDSSSPKQEETPIVNVPFYTAVTDSQLLFLDHKYEFKVNGEAKTLTLSDMTKTDDANIKKTIDNAFVILTNIIKKPDYTIYKANFPVKKGQTITFVGYSYSVKSDIPKNVETVDVLLFNEFMSLSDVRYYGGHLVSTLDTLCKKINQPSNETYIVK